MRTIKQLSVPQNTNTNLPFGGIVNETDTIQGTPVVEEIYGDVLSNIYKLLQITGITATNNQDNDDSQYQIIDALKKLPNNLNDIQQNLSLTTNEWYADFELEQLPNKYFFLANAQNDYVGGVSYIFKGNGLAEYPFTSDGFKTNDLLLIIINQAQVKAYSLVGSKNETILATNGFPIAFNSTNLMHYFDSGKLYNDSPNVYDLQSVIRVDLSDGAIIVKDVVIMNGFIICLCYGTNYFFRQFALTNLTVSSPVNLIGTTFSNTSNNEPYIFARNGFVYVSNDMNASSDDFEFSQLSFSNGSLTLVNAFVLENTFKKTTNYVIKNNFLYTIESGLLVRYDLSNSTKQIIGSYSTKIGQLISFNDFVYFVVGEVCQKWVI